MEHDSNLNKLCLIIRKKFNLFCLITDFFTFKFIIIQNGNLYEKKIFFLKFNKICSVIIFI